MLRTILILFAAALVMFTLMTIAALAGALGLPLPFSLEAVYRAIVIGLSVDAILLLLAGLAAILMGLVQDLIE